MIQLTRDEFNILHEFQFHEWAKGNGNWLTDHLACRGLLMRKEKVFRLENPCNVQWTQHEKTERAATCHYRLSRRGEKALLKPHIVGEVNKTWRAEE